MSWLISFPSWPRTNAHTHCVCQIPKCANIVTPKTYNFPFVPNGKLYVLGVQLFMHITVKVTSGNSLRFCNVSIFFFLFFSSFIFCLLFFMWGEWRKLGKFSCSDLLPNFYCISISWRGISIDVDHLKCSVIMCSSAF